VPVRARDLAREQEPSQRGLVPLVLGCGLVWLARNGVRDGIKLHNLCVSGPLYERHHAAIDSWTQLDHVAVVRNASPLTPRIGERADPPTAACGVEDLVRASFRELMAHHIVLVGSLVRDPGVPRGQLVASATRRSSCPHEEEC